jgi:predicted amidohydrolase
VQDLDVLLVQCELAWEQPEDNRRQIQGLIDSEQAAVDLIVLPEMFTTGFSMNAVANAESPGGATEQWLQQLARDRNCALTGSIAVQGDGGVYNRMLFATILLQVCYDLRFPVFSRNLGDYDLALYVANWPASRRQHWRQLLIARAIENQACVLGVNRIGSDARGMDYSGDSLAIAADGSLLADLESHANTTRLSLDANMLEDYREGFPCHLDADEFRLE